MRTLETREQQPAIRDFSASESYLALRNALFAIQDDASAVFSLISSLSDNAVGWMKMAEQELRQTLVQGRLQDAERIGHLIGVVLHIQEQSSVDELAENRIHSEGMQLVIDGIGAILAQDNLAGITHLERLTEAVYCSPSLQWVAWIWTARASADDGNMALAKMALEVALNLAQTIDLQAQGATLCTAGEIEFLFGELDLARKHLTEAAAAFEQIKDRRGTAAASLTLARMLIRLDHEADGLQVARQAQKADPDWDEPMVFLSQQALLKGHLDEAEKVLRPFNETGPRSPDLNRQWRILKDVRERKVSLATVAQYLRLKEQPPTEENLAEIRALWTEHQGFLPLHELMGWNLIKMGHEDEAALHFEALAEQDLDPETQASVLLGLGCLANRRFGHRQSAARVRAAASALPASLRVPEKSRGLAQEDAREEEVLIEIDPVHLIPEPSTASYSAPPAARPKAAFNGDLQLFSVPDLLGFLKSSRRTGTLVITSKNGIGAIHLRQGMITGAASPNSANIGDLLFEKGIVSKEKLKAAADFQQSDSPGQLLGAILVRDGLVDRQTLAKVLVEQIKRALFEVVGWTSGRFAFEPDKRSQVENDSEITVELDTEEMLLDVVRQRDEQNRV